MRRRRRSKATWFPLIPTTYGEGLPGVTWFESTLTYGGSPAPGDTTVIAQPLTYDNTENIDTASSEVTLRDYVEGQDYLLQRVVGKVWCWSDTTATAPSESIACMALAVLPCEPGEDTPALPAEAYNPLFTQNAQQPWIWRRTWRLSNGINNPTPGGTQLDFPATTSWYGSIQDGGHLDSKVKRRITREHRLFIITAHGTIVEPETPEPASILLGYGYDLRVLGTMRRGRNRSSF